MPPDRPHSDAGRTPADAPLDAPLAVLVARYRDDGDLDAFLAGLAALIEHRDAAQLVAAAEPFRSLPEVIGPIYERVVAMRPADASAIVTLAGAYWMAGRGPDVVGELASRAIAADPANRGAWHLWALAEPDIRARVTRWSQVAARFPRDELARANLADNAASLAGAEEDAGALALAISTYESLLPSARHPDQRAALEQALATLRSWRL